MTSLGPLRRLLLVDTGETLRRGNCTPIHSGNLGGHIERPISFREETPATALSLERMKNGSLNGFLSKSSQEVQASYSSKGKYRIHFVLLSATEPVRNRARLHVGAPELRSISPQESIEGRTQGRKSAG